MSRLSQFFCGKSEQRRTTSPQPIVFRVEQLEDRLAPVVGAFAVPAAVTPPSQYDGVVLLATANLTGGSGSLIQTGTGWGFGHQILTVAHHIAKGPSADKDPGGNPVGSALAVRFHLARGGNPVGITINVPKNIDGGAQYQVQHSAYVNNDPGRNDIGLLVLTDQVTGMAAPDRLLVAPYSAQQYALYNGVPGEVTQQFTMVGYGLTGTGATGANQYDAAKRAGQNRFDATGALINPAWTEQLAYDFDRLNAPGGQGNMDTLGWAYDTPNAGLGAAESMHAKGDSGGPAFVGANVIAGVLSRLGTLNRVAPAPRDSGFGDIGYVTNVSMTITSEETGDPILRGVLNPGGGAQYHLVLDMEQQVYGKSPPVGGGPDNLNITVQNVGGFLEIQVAGVGGSADPALSGMYYRAPMANIKSLTLRGSADNETFTIVGDLGISGGVYVDGRGGDDTFTFEDSIADTSEHHYTLMQGPDPAWDVQLNRAVIHPINGFQFLHTIDVKNIDKYHLHTSPGLDRVGIVKAPTFTFGGGANVTGLYVSANAGDDIITIGADAGAGTSAVLSRLYVAGGGGTNTLIYHNAGGFPLTDTYTLGASDQLAWDARLQRLTPEPVYSSQINRYELHAAGGSDVIQIDAVPATVTGGLFVKGNAGNDTITVGTATAGAGRHQRRRERGRRRGRRHPDRR